MNAHLIDTEALRREMEYLAGDALARDSRWAGTVSPVEALAILDQLAAAEHRADEAEGVHRDLTSSLGFGDGITEPMADNETIINAVGQAVTAERELWELTQAACVEAECDPEEDCDTHHPVRRAERAEHRATRAEAQAAIRGWTVAIHRGRALVAEARIKAVRDVLELHGPAHDEPGQDEADCGPQIIADIRRALEG